MINPRTPEGRDEIRRGGAQPINRVLDLVEELERERDAIQTLVDAAITAADKVISDLHTENTELRIEIDALRRARKRLAANEEATGHPSVDAQSIHLTTTP